MIDISEATQPLAAYVRPDADETVVVTMNGEPIAAVVSLKYADRETVTLSTNPRFIETIERARQEIREGHGISSQEMRRRPGLPSK